MSELPPQMWFIEAEYIFMYLIFLIKVYERIYFLKEKRPYENNEIYDLLNNDKKRLTSFHTQSFGELWRT